MIEHNYHSRWGELDLIAVKSDEDDFVGEMYFDEEMQEMNVMEEKMTIMSSASDDDREAICRMAEEIKASLEE